MHEKSRLKCLLLCGAVSIATAVSAVSTPGKAPFKSIYFSDTTNMFTQFSPWHPVQGGAGNMLTPPLLRGSVDEAAYGGADVFVLEPGLCWVPWWNGPFLPLDEHYAWFRKWSGKPTASYGILDQIRNGADLVRPVLDRARAKGMAAFISLRLNDGNHKGTSSNQFDPAIARIDSVPQYYIEHKNDWMITRDGRYPDGWPSQTQFLLDWSNEGARETRLAMIKELCEIYEPDGLVLDFLRAPFFFHPEPGETLQNILPDATARRVAIMKEFVSKVRVIMDAATASGGKRKWLCVRIPAYTAHFAYMGIDPSGFAEAGANMFILSTMYDWEQQTEAKTITSTLKASHPDSAVYHEITHSPETWTEQWTEGDPPVAKRLDWSRFGTDVQIYATANLAYARGLDGMAFFNFQYYRQGGAETEETGPWCEPSFRVLGKVRNPEWLARQPQEYFLSAVRNSPHYRPIADYQLGDSAGQPLVFARGAEKTFRMEMKRPVTGWAVNGMLRMKTRRAMNVDCIFKASINGTELVPCDAGSEYFPNPCSSVFVGSAEQARGWVVPSSCLEDGENTITLKFESGTDASVIPTFLSVAIDTNAPEKTFELFCDVPPRTVMAGETASWDINVAMVDGLFNGEVVFSASGLPAGATATFTNNTHTGPKTKATTLKVATTTSAAPGIHNLTVKGSNGGVDKTLTVQMEIKAITTAPAAPTGLRVTDAGRGQILLEWQPAPGADSYNVKITRKLPEDKNKFDYIILDNVIAPCFTSAGLAGETVYYYVVTALNAAGESVNSAEVAGRTLAITGAEPGALAPLAPLVVATGAGPVTLTAFAEGSPVPTFRWQVSKDNGANWSDLADGGHYAGTQTGALVINNANAEMNGFMYRFLAINNAGSRVSETATKLFVTSSCYQKPTGLTVDANNNLYITDVTTHAVYKMNAAREVSVLGGAVGQHGDAEGTGAAARFYQPQGIKIDPASGNLHIADSGNGKIRSMSATGQSGVVAGGAGQFDGPAAVAMDNQGDTYVADAGRHAILKIAKNGTVSLLAGSGDSGQPGTLDDTGAAARFNFPSGVAVDADGYIYVADTGNNVIRYIHPQDLHVGTFAGALGEDNEGCADGAAAQARFRGPRGLAVDGLPMSGGSLYVADTNNSLIREIVFGTVKTLAGHPGSDEVPMIAGVPGFKDGVGTEAWFNHPEDLTLDKDGNLLVADTGNGMIRKITFDSGDNAVVSTLAPDLKDTAIVSPGGGGDGGGSGGGGALSYFFVAVLIMLGVFRKKGK